jgi:ribosomal protein L12E/L44/L45/RPP1/RPP2
MLSVLIAGEQDYGFLVSTPQTHVKTNDDKAKKRLKCIAVDCNNQAVSQLLSRLLCKYHHGIYDQHRKKRMSTSDKMTMTSPTATNDRGGDEEEEEEEEEVDNEEDNNVDELRATIELLWETIDELMAEREQQQDHPAPAPALTNPDNDNDDGAGEDRHGYDHNQEETASQGGVGDVDVSIALHLLH